MSEHFVRHILRAGDYVATEFECRAPEGATCRAVCDTCVNEGREQCECKWQDPQPFGRTPAIRDTGTCGYLPWFDDAPEGSYDGPDTPVRGPDWQPIEFIWDSTETVSWVYA